MNIEGSHTCSMRLGQNIVNIAVSVVCKHYGDQFSEMWHTTCKIITVHVCQITCAHWPNDT